MPDKGQEVTLELRPATEDSIPQEQIKHIWGLYLEDLFGKGPGEQPTAEQVLVPEPGNKFAINIWIWMDGPAYGPMEL